MNKTIKLLSRYLISGLLLGCTQNVKHPGKEVTYADLSVGSWRSNLATEKRDIGMVIWNQSKYKPVEADFVNQIVESAKLNGVSLPALSVDTEQVADGSTDGYLQPAEIVFDGKKMTESGWNALSFKFSRETAWDSFNDRTSGSAAFRLDSAPAVSRLVFNPGENRIGVEFSEVVEGDEEPSPVIVEGPEGIMDCTFTWGVPHDRASVGCSKPFPATMTIRLKEGRLGNKGKPVTGVDGKPFELSVNQSEQPIQIDGLSAWIPPLPGEK